MEILIYVLLILAPFIGACYIDKIQEQKTESGKVRNVKFF